MGWSSWSECSVTCGLGVRKRERKLQKDSEENNQCKAELLSGVEQCVGNLFLY